MSIAFRTSRTIALFGCMLAGCSSSSTTETSDPTPNSPLEADIRPEGGEIVAPLESTQAGVALRIPKGALTSTVHVVLQGTIDATPLPPTADGIGPQVRILPEGTKLAIPAQLTVPFDSASRAGHRDAASECKVWTREGDGWARLEQTSSTEGSVTVAISTFATSAAGVVLRTKPSICGSTGCQMAQPSANSTQDAPCTSNTGFCVSKLVDPTKSFLLGRTEQLAVVGNRAYYAHSPGTNRVTMVQYDLGTGTSSTFVELAEPESSGFRYPMGNVAVESDGSAWIGVNGIGNVRFRASAPPTVFDREHTFSQGVTIDEGAVLRGTAKFVRRAPFTHAFLEYSLRRDATVQELFVLEGGGADPVFFNTPGRSDANPRVVVVAPYDGFEQFFFAPGPFNGALRDSESDGARVYGAATVSPSDGSFVVARAAHQTPFSIDWRFAPGQPNSVLLRTEDPVASMAIDTQQKLYFVNNESPEIMVVELGGAITRIGLTTASVGTAAHTRMIPKTIRYIREKDQFLLVTRGLAADKPELYLVKRASGG